MSDPDLEEVRNSDLERATFPIRLVTSDPDSEEVPNSDPDRATFLTRLAMLDPDPEEDRSSGLNDPASRIVRDA